MAVGGRFEKHKQPWSQDELTRLQQLATKGASLRAIAKTLGRSEDSVKAQAKALRLKISRLH